MTGSTAETFCRVTGWQVLGVMPNHAMATDGTTSATTFFWKDLR